MQIQYWAFVSMISGLILVIASVVADTVTGTNWWHLGTATGAGLFVYGMMAAFMRRRGAYRRN